MIDALDIGYAIKDRRAELGLTQAQLASAAGVSKRFLWSLELGQNPGAQFDKLTAVLDVLGLDLAIFPRNVSGASSGATIGKATRADANSEAAAGKTAGAANYGVSEDDCTNTFPRKNAAPQPPLEDCIPAMHSKNPGFNAKDILTGALSRRRAQGGIPQRIRRRTQFLSSRFLHGESIEETNPAASARLGKKSSEVSGG